MYEAGDRSISSAAGVPALLGLLLCLAAPLGAQPVIDHDDLGCLSREKFTQFLAEVEPHREIHAVKLYFRSRMFPEFYFVEMIFDEPSGPFEAVLPLPSEETTQVVYYIEALDQSFQTSRSEEIVVGVSGGSACQPGPGGLFFPGDPTIVVGATRAGMSVLPAGFQASGITGFISAAGAAGAAGGSGIGAGVAIGAAAGAAAGVGVVVAGAGQGGGGQTTSVVPSAGPGPTSSTTTTTSPGGPGPTSTTSTAGPATSTTGSTSTTTAAPTTTPASTTTAATTSVAPPPLVACIEWAARDNCWVDFNSCSTPEPIQTYEWRMLGPPPLFDLPSLKSFSFNFSGDPRCEGTTEFNRPVRLTVYDFLGRSASVQENITVRPGTGSLAHRTAGVALRFTSRLVGFPPDGSTRGQLTVNEVPLPPESDTAPRQHEIRVTRGIVRIEGAVAAARPGSLWELDFSSSETMAPGSLGVELGTAAVAEGRRVVLRLSGETGERFRIRIETR